MHKVYFVLFLSLFPHGFPVPQSIPALSSVSDPLLGSIPVPVPTSVLSGPPKKFEKQGVSRDK